MTLTLKIAVAGTALALFGPVVVSAQQQQPPRPDTGQMAADIGVSESALENCMPKPAAGQRPARPDAVKIATCLKSDNASVTQASVEQVLAKHGPKAKRGS